MKLSDLLREGRTTLTSYLADEQAGAQEALWLLTHALHITSTQAIMERERTVTERETALYRSLLAERIHNHKPLAYLMGNAPFCDLLLSVKPPILIPRPETEFWVETLIEEMRGLPALRILDLCTGSGCIALALAHHLPQSTVTGVDIDPEAIALANHNKANLNLPNVHFLRGDLFGPVGGQSFDLIVSNPPYLAQEEWLELPPTVKDWESKHALASGASGLEFYEKITAASPHFLSGKYRSLQKTELAFEYGHTQRKAVDAVLTKSGFCIHAHLTDLFGKERSTFACLRT